MRNTRTLTAAAVSLALAVSAAVAQGSGPTPVRAAYVPASMWLPAWVAKERGIFAAHGLDVTLSVAQNLGVLPGTAGRQFDLIPGTPPDLIKAAGAGIDVVAVAGATVESADHPTTRILVRSDAGISKAKDLEGKLIAVPAIGSVVHVSSLYWMKRNGVDLSKVRAVEVPFPSMGDQLKSKRVDAVEAVDPIAGSIHALGNPVLASPLLSVGNDVVFAFWLSQGAWARRNGPVLDAWRASLDEATAFISANPAEARRIMSRYTKLPEQLLADTPLPVYRTAIAPQDLDVWVSVMRDVGQLSRSADARQLVLSADR